MESYIKTNETGFIRDKNNNAILNTNIDELMAKRRQRELNNNTLKKLNDLEYKFDKLQQILIKKDKP